MAVFYEVENYECLSQQDASFGHLSRVRTAALLVISHKPRWKLSSSAGEQLGKKLICLLASSSINAIVCETIGIFCNGFVVWNASGFKRIRVQMLIYDGFVLYWRLYWCGFVGLISTHCFYVNYVVSGTGLFLYYLTHILVNYVSDL